jgi:tetratricopeptide (TPR) repeat protein
VIDKIVEFFLEKILPWFKVGKRWILLAPILVLFVTYYVVKALLSLPDFQATVTNLCFIIPSVVGTLFCLALYRYYTRLPPPGDRIVIAVTKFHPDSPDAKNEAAIAYSLVREALEERMEANEIQYGIKDLDEVINPRRKEDRELAAILGQHSRAHIVISATVRVREGHKFLFHPHITNLVHHAYRYSPRGDEAAKDGIEVPYQMRFAFEDEQADKIADLATLICGMARLNSGQYTEANRILGAIESPSPVMRFYRGFALLHMEEFEEARICFARATQMDPNFAYAWMYLGIALGKQGKDDQAREVFRHARDLAEPSGHGTEKDLQLLIEPLDNLIMSLSKIESELEKLDRMLQKGILLQRAVIEQSDRFNREGREWLETMESRIKGHTANLDYLRGTVLSADGRYEEAIASYDLALAVCSDHGSALAAKGLALRKLGKLDEAVDLLQRAVKLDCDDFERAQAYAVLGDREHALDHLSSALNQHPILVRPANAGDEFDPYRDDERFIRIVSEAASKLADSETGDSAQPQPIQAGETQ